MHISSRPPLLLILLFLPSCSWVEGEREEAAQAARAAAIVEFEGALSQAMRRADRSARSAERILRPLPVMTPADEDALRQFRNAAHVRRARLLGVRVDSAVAADSLLSDGRLVELQDRTQHWIVRRGSTPALVVPPLRTLLEIVGARFQDRLEEVGVPPYRFEITSALRTTERQRELRETNSNAAGLSSHEFGTTVDISYAAFAPPADAAREIVQGVPPELAPHVETIVDLAFESVSARKSREMGAIFSEVLQEAQDEGLALVIYERAQTVYHVTVASADPQG